MPIKSNVIFNKKFPTRLLFKPTTVKNKFNKTQISNIKKIIKKEISLIHFIFLTTSKLAIGIGIGIHISNVAFPYSYPFVVFGASLLLPTLIHLMKDIYKVIAKSKLDVVSKSIEKANAGLLFKDITNTRNKSYSITHVHKWKYD